MKAIACGSRDCTDDHMVRNGLDYAQADERIRLDSIITGADRPPAEIGTEYEGLKGVDDIAACYGNRAELPVETFAADWDFYKKRAGPIRNKQMLDDGNPDLVLAFPGGRGTNDMRVQAKKAAVPVFVWIDDEWVELPLARGI